MGRHVGVALTLYYLLLHLLLLLLLLIIIIITIILFFLKLYLYVFSVSLFSLWFFPGWLGWNCSSIAYISWSIIMCCLSLELVHPVVMDTDYTCQSQRHFHDNTNVIKYSLQSKQCFITAILNAARWKISFKKNINIALGNRNDSCRCINLWSLQSCWAIIEQTRVYIWKARCNIYVSALV